MLLSLNCEFRANGTFVAKIPSMKIGVGVIVLGVLVLAAEQTYASANCGFFAPLTELTRADDGEIGIPGYNPGKPDFLEGTLGREVPYTKDGYVRDWIGYPAPDDLDTETCDDESVLNYCYGAVPASLLAGATSFVGFATGAITRDFGGRDMCPLNQYEDQP